MVAKIIKRGNLWFAPLNRTQKRSTIEATFASEAPSGVWGVITSPGEK